MLMDYEMPLQGFRVSCRYVLLTTKSLAPEQVTSLPSPPVLEKGLKLQVIGSWESLQQNIFKIEL
jgi:hypothetical protein